MITKISPSQGPHYEQFMQRIKIFQSFNLANSKRFHLVGVLTMDSANIPRPRIPAVETVFSCVYFVSDLSDGFKLMVVWWF